MNSTKTTDNVGTLLSYSDDAMTPHTRLYANLYINFQDNEQTLTTIELIYDKLIRKTCVYFHQLKATDLGVGVEGKSSNIYAYKGKP